MPATRTTKLSRQEIALIKAMLARPIPRQDILAYFSRPGRSINMLRISEIRNGTKHADVSAASDALLQAFMDNYDRAVTQGVKVLPVDPLDPDTLAALVRLVIAGPSKLAIAENEQVEFKETFNWASPEHYAKVMAAFANNKGGYLLFGVNNEGIVVGTKREKFDRVDSGKITQFLNKHFAPAIVWDRAVVEVAGKTVCILYTYPAQVRPVVCVAEKQAIIEDGDIFYRYGGRNDRIRSGELRHLLDQRERDVGQMWLSKFHRMAEIGVQNVGLLNATSGQVEGAAGSFLIDKSLLDQMKVIREGEFMEKEGAPTLKLVGEIQTVSGDRLQPTIMVKEPTAISEADMLMTFLDQNLVTTPLEFIRSAVHRQGWYAPLYFFIRQARIGVPEAITHIEAERGGNSLVKTKLIKRLRAGGGCNVKPNTAVHPVRAQILAHGAVALGSREEAGRFLYAVQTLGHGEADLDYLLPKLRTCFDMYFYGKNAQLKGHLRKAASHLDWLFFGSDDAATTFTATNRPWRLERGEPEAMLQ